MNLGRDFLLGAATAAHQVEGNNINSDFWVMETLPGSAFTEPSGKAVDHYNRYESDILLLKQAGLNAYRFSIEWARIEPEEGNFDERELEHYRKVLSFCRKNDIEPVVTLHHFSSPKWLIAKGGWAAETTVNYFARYCEYIVRHLGGLMHYVCTLNEANMGLQMAEIMERVLKRMGIHLQVGMKLQLPEEKLADLRRQAQAFGIEDPMGVHPFLSQATAGQDELILRAHAAARDAVKRVCPELKVGLTLSLHHFEVLPGGEKNAAKRWDDEFAHYLGTIAQDDFIGIQNYTREVIGPDGSCPVPEEAEKTQMGYEFYPEALEQVLRRVSREYAGILLVTENGIGTADDTRRVEFIRRALQGVQNCISDGIPVKGYFHWSLLDNFEWQSGYSKTFGLVAVDRATQKRSPKKSLAYLGSFCKE